MMRRAHHWTVATVLLTTVGAAVTLTAGPALAAASSNATSVVRAADPPPFPRTLKLTGAVSQVQTTATIGPATFNPLRGYPTAVTTRSWTPARSPTARRSRPASTAPRRGPASRSCFTAPTPRRPRRRA
ncbi:hypothetical protein ACFQX7_14865 [Luedemannella flava]